MAGRRGRSPEVTPELLLRAYSIGLFPMAEFGRRPGTLLGRAGHARRHPARRLPHLAQPGEGDPESPFEIRFDTAFDAGDGGLRGGGARPPVHLDQRNDPDALRDAAPHGPCPQRRGMGRRQARRRPLRRIAGRGVLRREHVLAAQPTPRRSASCIWSSGCKQRGFRLLDTQFTTEHLKTFGAIDVPKADYEKHAGQGDGLAEPDLLIDIVDEALGKRDRLRAWARNI